MLCAVCTFSTHIDIKLHVLARGTSGLSLLGPINPRQTPCQQILRHPGLKPDRSLMNGLGPGKMLTADHHHETTARSGRATRFTNSC